MLRHEENLCLFVAYFVLRVYTLHNAFMHVDMYTYFIMFHAPLRMAQD